MAKLTSLQTINSNEVNLQDGLYLAHKVNDNPETYEDKRINIDALAGALPTEDIKYDNSESELTATNIQGAIDELAAGGREVLNDLTDVTISSPAANQLLQYNSITEKWENKPLDGIPTELSELSDVNIASTPEDGQVLSYDAASDKWIAGAPGSSGVELTQAEYDALEQAGKLEKNVPYFITDVNGDGSQFQPVIFSTTEREIGVWLDGKPLYEITLETDTQVKLNDTSWTTIPWNNEPSDIDFLVSAEIVRICPNTNSTMRFTLDGGHIKGASLVAGDYPAVSNLTERLVIRYTKSTDMAGSGTWTPQGVPAVHYSTDEQVVGTWIDGSTLYEKTINFGTLPNNTTKEVQHNISNVEHIWIAEGWAENPTTHFTNMLSLANTDIAGQWYFGVNQTVVQSWTGKDRTAYTNCYVVLRYTKSST